MQLLSSNSRGVLRLNSFNISVLSCWSIPGRETEGVAQAVSFVATSAAAKLLVHEKADTILAHATVSGTAAQLVTLSNKTCKVYQYNL